jgi:hypothetical protein
VDVKRNDAAESVEQNGEQRAEAASIAIDSGLIKKK